MRFYKQTCDGFIAMCGMGNGGAEIAKDEYSAIVNAISICPTAPDGYGYRLREDLTWELYELPVVEETEEELTTEYGHPASMDGNKFN